MPKRRDDWSGFAPRPGWDERFDWKGFVSAEELPSVHNPQEGMVVTANQDLNHLAGPNRSTLRWAITARVASPSCCRARRSRRGLFSRHSNGHVLDSGGRVPQHPGRRFSARARSPMRLRTWDCRYEPRFDRRRRRSSSSTRSCSSRCLVLIRRAGDRAPARRHGHVHRLLPELRPRPRGRIVAVARYRTRDAVWSTALARVPD